MTTTAPEREPLREDPLASEWRARLRFETTRADGGCWIWHGRIDDRGYGRITFGRRYEQVAHRLSYRLFVGPIPAGLEIDHLCRRRTCVNPRHLEAVTTRENILRGEGVAARRARQTHCKYGHEMTPENIYSPPSAPTRRCCRVCRAISSHAAYTKRRART